MLRHSDPPDTGQPPVLRTDRLVLRPFETGDAPSVATLAGDRDVALNTLNIPHPYEVEQARSWIESQAGQYQRREAVTFAITSAADGSVLGAVGLIVSEAHASAELGYWIGKPHWGRGLATEATRAVVDWGFRALELHRIHASHFPRNPASGRVLEKLGMRYEGRLREHVRKWGEFLDLERYGLLRKEWDRAD